MAFVAIQFDQDQILVAGAREHAKRLQVQNLFSVPLTGDDGAAIAALKTDVPMTYQDMNDYITRSIDVIIQAGRHEGARGITEFYLPGMEQIGAPA